jgi:rRNA maturation endonuclease Nob1
MIIILDSGAIIKGNFSFDFQNDTLYTIPQVLQEIKDEKSKQYLLTLDLKVKNPRPECIQEIINFSKSTGDLASLSKTDLRVLALTLELEKELGSNTINTTPTTKISHGDKTGNSLGFGDWITPENINIQKSKIEDEDVKVACCTTDFAMQNILLQMKMNLITIDKVRITKIKNWVLRCHACYKITKDMTKVFCPTCGNNTLIRTSYSIGKDGDLILYLKRNFQYNNRGCKYSIPLPKSGRNGLEMILREDQKEYGRSLKNYQKQNKITDPFDLDFMPLDGISKQSVGKPVIGHGRRNVNEVYGKRRK